MNNRTKEMVTAAVLAAFACVATMIIKIPSPFKGYLNMGDCIVLLSGWMLSPIYGFLAAGIGSALADVFLGYVTYAPATFVIKGMVAVIAFYIFKLFENRFKKLGSWIISGVLAEIFMVVGYFVFEAFLYGFTPSLVNIPANGVQGIVGIIVGVALAKILKRFDNISE